MLFASHPEFCELFAVLQVFLLLFRVVSKTKKTTHATGDPAYHKGDDIELRKQPLTAVTGFGLLGQRSRVKANTYSTLLQAASLIFLKLALTCFSQNLEIFMTAKKNPKPKLNTHSEKQTPSLTLSYQSLCTSVWNGS